MRTADMLPIAEKIDRVGYWAVEMWGGGTFDVAMRYLDEDPWERVRLLKEKMPKTPFLMLLRGQNVVGYKHYPDDVLDAFVVRAHANGIDIFRIFDALNDVRNMRKAMEVVKRENAHAQASMSYTTGPPYNVDYFVELAKTLADMGADTICIKDMAGLITPYVAFELVGRLKTEVDVPILLHSHATSGMSIAALVKAAEAGVDIVDTAISPLSMTTSHSPTESIVATLEGTERDTGFDLGLLAQIAGHFGDVRRKYARFESGLFGADVRVLQYQVPGGMLSNLVSQLRGQNAEDRYEEVLAEVPRVREELGYPPLVTPSSQIVGTQATLNVVLGERYKVIPDNTKQYVRGFYGRPPAPIDPKIKQLVIGDEEPIDCRPADLLEPGMVKAREEIGDLARSEEDVIAYALFPQVARPFLERRARGDDGKGPVIAAIAGLLIRQMDGQAGATPGPSGPVASAWKVSGRPGGGRWTGLVAGAGGLR
jgi:oxaloacetate decarboxylase alpha subunit